jgi:hypothetical protein
MKLTSPAFADGQAIPARYTCDGEVPKGARQGRNDFGRVGYGEPCPPPGHGIHRYFFTLHAVSTEIGLPEGATIAQLHDALRDETLADAQLLGTYER